MENKQAYDNLQDALDAAIAAIQNLKMAAAKPGQPAEVDPDVAINEYYDNKQYYDAMQDWQATVVFYARTGAYIGEVR